MPNEKRIPINVSQLSQFKNISNNGKIKHVFVETTKKIHTVCERNGYPATICNKVFNIWDVAIQEHNKFRRKHGVQDIKGDPGMHEEAQKYAEFLAETNRFETTTKGKYGNNIATSLRRTKTDAVRDAITRWYEKVKFYDYARGWFSVGGDPTATGSFTAIVWKSTTHLGVGIAWSDWERQWIVVVFYSPPAMRDEVRENVLRPRSSA